jgi:hypothetical protein
LLASSYSTDTPPTHTGTEYVRNGDFGINGCYSYICTSSYNPFTPPSNLVNWTPIHDL